MLDANHELAKRLGTSSRLLSHQLSTFTADEAKMRGSVFEDAWRTRHGVSASTPTPTPTPKPVAALTPTPQPVVTPPVKSAAVIEAERQAHAQMMEQARIKAARDVQAREEADRAKRRAEADGVWHRVNAKADALRIQAGGPGAQATSTVHKSVPQPVSDQQARSDAVWDRANSKVDARRDRDAEMSATAKTPAAAHDRSSDDVWAKVYTRPRFF